MIPRATDAGPHILATVSGGPASVDVNASAYTVYSAPVRTAHYDYNTIGQKVDSIDQYGGEADYTYDANRNLIRTVNPDGTETRSVYDVMNRLVWQTNTFVPVNGDPTSVANTAMATKTVYDEFGRKVETDVYVGVAIEISSIRLGSVGAATSEADGGTMISTSKTYYDPSGNAIETISPSGLRTGAIYNPDGSVEYTGPLATNAPDGGREVVINGVTTFAYLPSDFAYYTQTLAVTLARQLELLQSQLDEYRRRIGELFDQHPDRDCFGSLPGAGRPEARPSPAGGVGGRPAGVRVGGRAAELRGHVAGHAAVGSEPRRVRAAGV